MTMPPLPPPDLEEHETELWGQNVCDDYWRLAKVKAYGAACAAAAVAQEREECAKVCDDYAHTHAQDDDATTAQAWMMLQCAAAIRARGEA